MCVGPGVSSSLPCCPLDQKIGSPTSISRTEWLESWSALPGGILLLDCNPARSNTKQLPILILHRFMPNTRCQTHLLSLPPTSIYLWRKICFSQRRDFHAPPTRSQIGGRPRPTAPSQSRAARTERRGIRLIKSATPPQEGEERRENAQIEERRDRTERPFDIFLQRRR